MEIRVVEEKDKAFVMSIDRHANDVSYRNRVFTRSGYVIWDNDTPVGMMVHSMLWDVLPFLNFLHVKEEYRGRGFGSGAMLAWEREMKDQGCKMTLVSTQVDETAQHMYRKLGYIDCGGLIFQGTPSDQPMEMFMRKVL